MRCRLYSWISTERSFLDLFFFYHYEEYKGLCTMQRMTDRGLTLAHVLFKCRVL
jgi:hypothetical protein